MEKFVLDVRCPCCDESFEIDLTEDIQEILSQYRPQKQKVHVVHIQMQEVIDYIFTKLVKMGYTPSSQAIFDTIMIFNEFMDKRAREFYGETENYHG